MLREAISLIKGSLKLRCKLQEKIASCDSAFTHPVNFPCGDWKLEKTHDFRQSVNELFPRAIRCSCNTRFKPMTKSGAQTHFFFLYRKGDLMTRLVMPLFKVPRRYLKICWTLLTLAFLYFCHSMIGFWPWTSAKVRRINYIDLLLKGKLS